MNSRLYFEIASRPQCLRPFTSPQKRLFSQRCLNSRWPQAPQSARVSPRLRPSRLMLIRHESNQAGAVNGTKRPVLSEKEEKYTMPNLRPEGKEDPRDVPPPEKNERGEVPAYELTFTCKPCKTRSAHRISKHGYHNGTVLITCPNCKNRHVISDHLKIFNDSAKSFEQILREKAELLKTGTLDPDGDFEMWDDGTQTPRQKGADGVSAAGQTPAAT